MPTKSIKLSAFFVEQNAALNQKEVSIVELLKTKKESKANDRRMMLSKVEDDKEEDCAIDLNIENDCCYGILMRYRVGEDTTHVSEDMFQKTNFNISDLVTKNSDSFGQYMKHYYFCISDKYLITNLPSNQTSKRFATYFGWLLTRDDFEFNPIIVPPRGITLADIKAISIGGGKASKAVTKNNTPPQQSEFASTIKNIALNIVDFLLRDGTTLTEEQLSAIVSARLILKFRKPNKMTDEEYMRTYAAMFNPIADADNVVLETKKDGNITGEDCKKIKIVDIESTDRGNLVDNDIYREMRKFIAELNNEALS
ncbi:hypothetical protein [Seleniivibrio woodruffii]|uniref:hypothetical protein n=1 Tax=Seleniivibrio woodruffii TaxID=1078050 RepID=UPI00240903B2|nr:hypothetical protein [Seleniivibrio woodruffii]